MSSPNDDIAIPIETEPTSSVSTSALQENSICYNSFCCCCSNGNNCDYSSCSIFWCIIDFICGGCCSAM